MIEFASLPPTVQAVVLIGIVLVQAVALYVGYGLVLETIAPRLFERIERA